MTSWGKRGGRLEVGLGYRRETLSAGDGDGFRVLGGGRRVLGQGREVLGGELGVRV